MKKFTAIVLFIFVIQLTSGAVNEMGVFDTDVKEIDGVEVSQLNNSLHDQNTVDDVMPEGIVDSMFAGARLIITSLSLFLSAVLNTIVIMPTLMAYGIPLPLAAIFQGLTTVIEVFAVIELKTRSRVT